MCGIAGFLGHIDSSVESWSRRSLDSLGHRGPDGSGSFIDKSNGVVLLHTRLSIQDVSPLGDQPMSNMSKSVHIVFNGEIYNFTDIREDLVKSGFMFRGNSDTEVLLAAYEAIKSQFANDSFVEKLRRLVSCLKGIYSFAIWDSELSLFFFVRDSMGVKPLYYEITKSGIYFASEIKALPLVEKGLCYAAIDRYLSYQWNPGTSTPLKSVHKLAPNSTLVADLSHPPQIFTNSISTASVPSRFSKSSLSRRACISQTRELLRTAVERQLVSDVPVGAFLSGGLDSSSVVTFAKQRISNLRCFTIRSSGSSTDGFSEDFPYASYVARFLDVPLDVVEVDASIMASSLESMVLQLDEPLADPAPLCVYYISKLARSTGIKVMLSGAGGDDLFTGYRRHFVLTSERYWSWLPGKYRSHLYRLSRTLPVSNPFLRRIRKALSVVHLDQDSRLIEYFRWIDRADLNLLYTQQFRESLVSSQPYDPMADFLASLPDNISPLERMLALEQRFFLVDHNLTYTDKMSMAAGVEVRVPFLDEDLVQFAAQIPAQYKQRGRQGKWVLKKAMEPFLPHKVIYRPKTGFGSPIRQWFRHELRDWLADTLSYERLLRRGLFDPYAVHRLMTANLEGRIDASYTLLSLACIEIWCRAFIDGDLISSSNQVSEF